MNKKKSRNKRLDILKDKLTIQQISQYTGWDITELEDYFKINKLVTHEKAFDKLKKITGE